MGDAGIAMLEVCTVLLYRGQEAYLHNIIPMAVLLVVDATMYGAATARRVLLRLP